MDSTIAWLINASIQASIKYNLLIFGKKFHFLLVFTIFYCQVLQNTGRAIKKEQPRETDHTGHKRRRKTQRNMCRTPPYPNKHNQGK